MVAPVVARGPYQGRHGERLPNPEASNSFPGGGDGFLAIPDAPHVPAAGEYKPAVLSRQFQAEDVNESKGRLGFRRTQSLGDDSRITVTHSGISFGSKLSEGIARSQGAHGVRTNVKLPGGYYFRRQDTA